MGLGCCSRWRQRSLYMGGSSRVQSRERRPETQRRWRSAKQRRRTGRRLVAIRVAETGRSGVAGGSRRRELAWRIPSRRRQPAVLACSIQRSRAMRPSKFMTSSIRLMSAAVQRGDLGVGGHALRLEQLLVDRPDADQAAQIVGLACRCRGCRRSGLLRHCACLGQPPLVRRAFGAAAALAAAGFAAAALAAAGFAGAGLGAAGRVGADLAGAGVDIRAAGASACWPAPRRAWREQPAPRAAGARDRRGYWPHASSSPVRRSESARSLSRSLRVRSRSPRRLSSSPRRRPQMNQPTNTPTRNARSM